MFRDIVFVRAGRLQIHGPYREIHINARICDLAFRDTKQTRNRHIYIYIWHFLFCFFIIKHIRTPPSREGVANLMFP